MNQQRGFPSLRYPTSLLFILTLLLPNLTFAQTLDFVENRPSQIFPVSNTSPRFAIDLDFPQAFEVTIKSFNGNESATGFCETYPSKIVPQIQWLGTINPFPSKDTETDTGETLNHYYDNIEFYQGYFFVLDSVTFNIIVIKDLTKPSTFKMIESNIQNDNENEEIEDTYLIIDPDDAVLFIVTRKKLLSYDLTQFLLAINDNKPLPKINDFAPNYKGYEMLLSVNYNRHRLFIVADDVVEVFVIEQKGAITPQIKLDASYLLVDEVSLTGIAFRGNYAFILDRIKGIYVIDLSKVDTVDQPDLKVKYKYVPEVTREISKGQFIEIIGNSLFVISADTKSPFIFEFIIRGDPELLSLEPNRKIDLFQSVIDTYSDENFLYLITGFFNMVVKHSIPGRYHTEKVNNYISEYFPLFGAKALKSVVQNGKSYVVAIQEKEFAVFQFSEANPFIACNTAGVSEGIYKFKLQAVQKDCNAKRRDRTADYNTVCEINQDLELLVIDDTAAVADVEGNKKTVVYLIVGIVVMGLLVVVLIFLFRKYKNQYHNLENRIKFKKLEEDNTDSRNDGKKSGPESQNEIPAYNINIQAELEKDEEREKKAYNKKSPNKPASPAVGENRPNAEIGDLKPLDIEGIYGSKKNQKNDDDSF